MIDLTQEQIDQIADRVLSIDQKVFDKIVKDAADVAAQVLVMKLQQVQKVHMEIYLTLKDAFEQNPELKGRHKELEAIMTRFENADPSLKVNDLLTMGIEELKRAN